MTIGAKREKKIEPSAGPGAYDPDRAADAIRTSSPTAKFSKSKGRPESMADPAHKGTAGPGEYYSAQPFDAKAKPITINKEPRDKRPDP